MVKQLRRSVAAVLSTVLLLLTGYLITVPGPAAAAEQRLPDLGMAPLSDIRVTKAANGQFLLRFSATVVNVGAERFQVVAGRPTTDPNAWTTFQRVFNSDGSYVDQPVGATLVFGGDGHSHWHVKDLASYELVRLDNGVKVGTSAKGGFCFFDTTRYRLSLPGAPSTPYFGSLGCGHQNDLAVSMGISVGWGDTYPWTLPDQYIDITGLTNGHYRLVATADAAGLFTESDGGNNTTWTDIVVTTNRHGKINARVLAQGPAA